MCRSTFAVSPAIEYRLASDYVAPPGPVPEGRRMFDVSAEETTQLAEANDLQRILRLEAKSVQQANRLVGLTWTHPAFVKAI
jgi:hypothetical protein